MLLRHSPNWNRGWLFLPARMWFREASMRSMKEAGTVMVFLVSSSMSSFRVITWAMKRRSETQSARPAPGG